MTLTKVRNTIVLALIVVLALALADVDFDPFDDDTDLRHNERLVEVRFFAGTSPNTAREVRFDIIGGFREGKTDFDRDAQRNGHRELGVAEQGEIVWGTMYMRADSEPKYMWCEVWQGKVNITGHQEKFPEFGVAACEGMVQ